MLMSFDIHVQAKNNNDEIINNLNITNKHFKKKLFFFSIKMVIIN